VDLRSCDIFVITLQLLDEIMDISQHPEIADEIGIATLRPS
jgi:hypothetical protein